MEERPSESNANVDSSVSPSVAQLAGRFREQAAAATETPASKPARRKPPCSLPLFPPKVELGQDGDEKLPPNASHAPKIKVKSSPLIEKLQANLTFDPAALLPGASPKSPGLKASPFHSPPSTPSSPGTRSRPGEVEEVPVSFDQPPEGSHLPCYNKVRTRGSIKRRPPSRRFRRSQSDCGELGDFRAPESSQENGAREENGDEVFPAKSKTPGSPPSSEGAGGAGARRNKPALRRSSSKPEERAKQSGEAPEPPRSSSPGPENGHGSPKEERAAGECTEEKGERAGHGEEGPGHRHPDAEKPEEAAGQGDPQSPPAEVGDSSVPEQENSKEEQEEGVAVEPGCSPGTGQAAQDTSRPLQDGQAEPTDDSPVQDTKM